MLDPEHTTTPIISAYENSNYYEGKKLELGQMYVGLINARNQDTALRWSRAQIFLVLNSGALTLIPSLLLVVFTGDWVYVAILLLSVFGISLSLLWLSVTYRANHWVHFWNERLANLEQWAGLPEQLRAFSQKNFEKQNWVAPSFHHTLVGLAGFFTALWFGAILWSGMTTVTAYRTGFKSDSAAASPAAATPAPSPSSPAGTQAQPRTATPPRRR